MEEEEEELEEKDYEHKNQLSNLINLVADGGSKMHTMEDEKLSLYPIVEEDFNESHTRQITNFDGSKIQEEESKDDTKSLYDPSFQELQRNSSYNSLTSQNKS